jgi:alpha-galactosidase
MLIRLLPLVLLLSTQPVAQPARTVTAAGFEIGITSELAGFDLKTSVVKIADGVDRLDLTLTSRQPAHPPRIALKWRIPSHDVAGHWMTSRVLNKAIRPDWTSGRLQPTMFAKEAPVSTLFSSTNRNVLTFAVSDALNTIQIGSGVREEDGWIYNEVSFFSERHKQLTDYTASVRIDRRDVPYETALKEVAEWWAAQPGYAPAPVPAAAWGPVYSTWYNYHQSVDSAELVKDLAVAKQLGFESIIVDDGWQTLDTNRGYAFTGDWKPERMTDMKAFVEQSQKLGVKVVLWYAVPFIGKNSSLVSRFRDKSLRFTPTGLAAYTLDPRYPDVREYLIDIYRAALRDWKLDGFKLDFIDRFVADEQTVLDATSGRDYASVNEGADRLMTDVIGELRKINPDVMLEFRQPYIGPLIRKYGNMFRASDSPNAYLTNKVKSIDLRLLGGSTAVHGDMVMWHESEPVEKAALQLLNILFAVPQVSVKLREIPKDHLAMTRFYLDYYNRNRDVLVKGDIDAPFPTMNYPLVRGYTRDKQVVALYADVLLSLDGSRPTSRIDIVNAKGSRQVVMSLPQDLGTYRYDVRDCQGRVVKQGQLTLVKGLMELEVPLSGLVSLERVTAASAAARN